MIVEEKGIEEQPKPATTMSPNRGSRFHQAMLQKAATQNIKQSPTKTPLSLEERLKYRPNDDINTSPSKLQARAQMIPTSPKKKDDSIQTQIATKPVNDILFIAAKQQITILHFPGFNFFQIIY